MDGPTHLQEILTGRKQRSKTTPWPVYLVLLLALLGGGGWWLKTQMAAEAGPAGEVDTDICDKLLTAASEAQPGQFLFCASRKKTIYKITGGRREPMLVMANAVYELDLDHKTRVEGLSSSDMRYGLKGKSCAALKAPYQNQTFLLADPPIDPKSC